MTSRILIVGPINTDPYLCTGSSFAWEKYQDSGADNLVPIEIALRIVHAIDHDERFTAYLVIPLHPERPGPQRSAILLYTWHTIAMMYRCTPLICMRIQQLCLHVYWEYGMALP